MRPLLTLLALAGFALGCSLAVKVQTVGGPGLPPRANDCDVRFFRGTTDLELRCERLAVVRVRDSGFSTNCGSDAVRLEIRRAACKVGGDTALLLRIASPHSTCVQEDAEIFQCASPRAPLTGARGTGPTQTEETGRDSQ